MSNQLTLFSETTFDHALHVGVNRVNLVQSTFLYFNCILFRLVTII